jgi:hypothetical protein
MKVEVVRNSTVDPTCPDKYFRVTWYDDDTSPAWKAMVFPDSDPRLQRYMEAVERLKYELGVDAEFWEHMAQVRALSST